LTKTEILKTDQRDLTRPDTSEKSKRVEIENELKDQKRLKRAKVGTKREQRSRKFFFRALEKRRNFQFSIFKDQKRLKRAKVGTKREQRGRKLFLRALERRRNFQISIFKGKEWHQERKIESQNKNGNNTRAFDMIEILKMWNQKL